MNATDLFGRYSMEQLVEMEAAMRIDSANKTPLGSFWLYTKKARKKMGEIAWAITYHLQQKKEEGKDRVNKI